MMFAKTFKFSFFYLMLVVLASGAVSLVGNPDHTVVRGLQDNYSEYPSPQFFSMVDRDLKSIPRPPMGSIRQFRGSAQRWAHFDVDFDPDRLAIEKVEFSEIINSGAHTASKSSPISSDDYLIIAGDQGLVQILNKKDLSPHWELELFDSQTGFHGTPITFSHYAFIGDYAGKLYFLDLKERQILWVIDLGSALGATPFFDGEFLYANVELSGPPNGYAIKLDPFEKKIIWKTPFIGEQSHSSFAVSNDSLFFGDNQGDFYRLEKSTGRVLWKALLGKPVKSTPVLFENLVIFSSWERQVHALNMDTGAFVWSLPLAGMNQSSLAVDPQAGVGFINAGNGILKMNLRTGELLGHYAVKMDSNSNKASPIVLRYRNKTRVVSSCGRRELCLLDAKTMQPVQKFSLEEGISNEVAVLDQSLFVVCNRGATAYQLRLKR